MGLLVMASSPTIKTIYPVLYYRSIQMFYKVYESGQLLWGHDKESDKRDSVDKARVPTVKAPASCAAAHSWHGLR